MKLKMLVTKQDLHGGGVSITAEVVPSRGIVIFAKPQNITFTTSVHWAKFFPVGRTVGVTVKPV